MAVSGGNGFPVAVSCRRPDELASHRARRESVTGERGGLKASHATESQGRPPGSTQQCPRIASRLRRVADGSPPLASRSRSVRSESNDGRKRLKSMPRILDEFVPCSPCRRAACEEPRLRPTHGRLKAWLRQMRGLKAIPLGTDHRRPSRSRPEPTARPLRNRHRSAGTRLTSCRLRRVGSCRLTEPTTVNQCAPPPRYRATQPCPGAGPALLNQGRPSRRAH